MQARCLLWCTLLTVKDSSLAVGEPEEEAVARGGLRRMKLKGAAATARSIPDGACLAARIRCTSSSAGHQH